MPKPLDKTTEAAALYMQHHGFVRALAVRFAPWPGIVDDVAQQVFLEYMQGADRWDLDRDIRPLLTTITRRTANRLWKQSLKSHPDELVNLAEHVRQLVETRERAVDWSGEVQALRECLRRLPGNSLRLLDWYYFKDISTEEIGDRLSMKREAVQRALSRLRDKLRKCVRLTMQSRQNGAAYA